MVRRCQPWVELRTYTAWSPPVTTYSGVSGPPAWGTAAIAGAPVSAPLGWDEIAGLGRPDAFTIANLPARLETVGDLLSPALKLAQKLPTRAFTTGEKKKAQATAKGPAGGRAAGPAKRK